VTDEVIDDPVAKREVNVDRFEYDATTSVFVVAPR